MTTLEVDDAFVRATAAAIEEAFGTRFDLWLPGDPWHRLLPDQTVDSEKPPLDLLVHLEKSVRSEAGPFVEPAGGSWLLVIPVRRIRRVTAVATATFDISTPELLVRMACLFLERFRLQRDLQQQCDQTEACAAEITQAFEELMLLRRIAEYLELSEVSRFPLGVAEAVLPLLKDTIHAESVLLISADRVHSESGGAAIPVGELAVCAGPRSVDADVWRGLVEHYRDAAAARPAVKNYLAESPEELAFPGVREFILVPVTANDELLGWILAINRRESADAVGHDEGDRLGQLEFGTTEAGLVSTTASILAVHARNVMLFQEKEDLFLSAVRSLVCAIDAKDTYTRGHSERVGLFARRLGEELDMDEKDCSQLYLSGLLHDVGKIAIQEATLSKPGRLTDEEFAEIKKHPECGWQILHDLDRLGHVLPAVVHHHEQYDGTGYPDRLRGDEIPLAARILAVADSYDAMTSDRPYRKGMPQEKVEAILRSGTGAQWDRRVVEAMLRAMPDMIRIRREYRPRSSPQRKPCQAAVPVVDTARICSDTQSVSEP